MLGESVVEVVYFCRLWLGDPFPGINGRLGCMPDIAFGHPGGNLGVRSVRVLRIDVITSDVAPDILACCRFAASRLLHFEIVVAKVNSFSFRKSSTVSPSMRPSII